MSERPILLSGPMVRAILDGRKTQTRRVIAKQPFDRSWSRHDHRIQYVSGRAENQDETDGFHAYSTSSGGEWHAKSPFGQPGDRLWLRETWCNADVLFQGYECDPPQVIGYRADLSARIDGNSTIGTDGWNWGHESVKWKPSIHMPRWASRILLEVTDVRVERLQAITEADAEAEGVTETMPGWWSGAEGQAGTSARAAFCLLWNSLNAARGHGWDANPWVWVVSFKLAEVSA